jgi:hypothetical protein
MLGKFVKKYLAIALAKKNCFAREKKLFNMASLPFRQSGTPVLALSPCGTFVLCGSDGGGGVLLSLATGDAARVLGLAGGGGGGSGGSGGAGADAGTGADVGTGTDGNQVTAVALAAARAGPGSECVWGGRGMSFYFVNVGLHSQYAFTEIFFF